MTEEFTLLGSSSSGNCGLLQTGHTQVLIDIGFSAKRVDQLLKNTGLSLEAIDAVFLTHEHGDHSQGIRGLAKRFNIPVFANKDTADAVQSKVSKPVNWQLFQTGTEFTFRDLTIRSFSVPHDAYDPVGFTFTWGSPDDLFYPLRKLAWATDLGYVPEHVKAHLSDANTLVIEANYDEALLEGDTRRPWSTKQRIRGRHGHLSNEATFSLISEIAGSFTLEDVILVHLSQDCNNVELVRKKFSPLTAGLRIQIADPEPVTPSATAATTEI